MTGPLAWPNGARLVPQIGHTMEVTGEVTDKGGKIKMMIDADAIRMVKK